MVSVQIVLDPHPSFERVLRDLLCPRNESDAVRRFLV